MPKTPRPASASLAGATAGRGRAGSAGELREIMVRALRDEGVLVSGPVACTFPAVPRHVFAAGETLEAAYAPHGTVVPRWDPGGLLTSVRTSPPATSGFIPVTAGDVALLRHDRGMRGYHTVMSDHPAWGPAAGPWLVRPMLSPDGRHALVRTDGARAEWCCPQAAACEPGIFVLSGGVLPELAAPLGSLGPVARFANPSLWDAIATAVIRQVVRAGQARVQYRALCQAHGAEVRCGTLAGWLLPSPEALLGLDDAQFAAIGLAFKREAQARATAEPSSGPIGALARNLVNEVTGHALACLVTADRYYHLATEIRPHLAAGRIVVCDRYLASTLVLQGRDGLPRSWLLALNEHIDLPGLAVILAAEPGILAARLDQRGRHDRFEDDPAPPGAEDAMFTAAADVLAERGVPVIRIDTSHLTPQVVAARIADAAQERCASLTGHG